MRNIKNKRVALVTGINGQDGSYLSEFLLEKNYYRLKNYIDESTIFVDFKANYNHIFT